MWSNHNYTRKMTLNYLSEWHTLNILPHFTKKLTTAASATFVKYHVEYPCTAKNDKTQMEIQKRHHLDL